MKEQLMCKLAAAIGATAFALAVPAQQPLQCVNPQLLNGLVFLGRSELKINVTPGQPAFMKDVKVPAGLVLIGSGVRQGGMTTVAYKTSLTSEKAFAGVVAGLEAEGWMVEARPGQAATFNVAGSPREGTLCRDGRRRDVTVAEVGGVRYVNVAAFGESRRRGCNEDPFASPAFLMGPGATPRFQFPEGTSLARGAGAGGGSDRMYSTSSRIISADTPARLVEYLASQLEGQGWQADSTWSATSSAGSTWRKTHEGEPATGALEIVRVSEGTYDVDFTLVLPD
jgi:hypothetical protein